MKPSHLSILRGVAASEHVGKPQSKEGWQQLLRQETTQQQWLTPQQYNDLDSRSQREYNISRNQHHIRLDAIRTTQMSGALDALWQRFSTLQGGSRVARPGMMISGPANAGKSTALIEFGREVELGLRHETQRPLHGVDEDPYRLPHGAEYLPVCYFSLTDQVVSALSNAVRFYNPSLPVTRKYSRSDLLTMLTDYIHECRTSIILMDQVQLLKNAAVGAQAVSDALKDLMDACPSTMLAGAGIGLEKLRIFTDGYAPEDEDLAQTGSRFALYPMKPYRIDTPEDRKDWLRLLATVDQHLILHNKQDKDLLILSEHIYNRTGGLTGVVMPLLRTAANKAIETGTERVTKDILDSVYTTVIRDINAGHIDVDSGIGPKGAIQPQAKKAGKPRGRPRSHIISSAPRGAALT